MSGVDRPTRARRAQGCVGWSFVALWCLCLVGGAGWIVLETGGTYGLYCETVRPSLGGTVRWQLLPPGYYCEWEEDGETMRSSTSPFPAFWLVAMAGSAVGFAYVARGWADEQDDATTA